MEVEIGRAGPERWTELASLFGRAFVTEPMMRWPLGEHDRIDERFVRCFEYFLEDLGDCAIVDEAGVAAGAAIWIPAEHEDALESAQTQARMHTLTEDGGRRFDFFWSWVEAQRPHESLWHLDSVAVEPALQGRGIGRALIEHGLTHARAAGSGVLLETGSFRNVPLYERVGFRTYLAANAPKGGPHIWFMRWDP